MWLHISRLAVLLSVTATAQRLLANEKQNFEVRENRIYTTAEAARLLGIDRQAVLRLIGSGGLQARMVGSNYQITGRSILDYVNHEI